MHPRIRYAIAISLLATACRNKDQLVPPNTPTGPVTQREINNWMLDSMRYFYLWNDQLPSSADTVLTTNAFFDKMKSKDDRFSFLYKPSDLSSYPKYMLYLYGFDFSIIDWPGAPGGAMGVVRLVIPYSRAADLHVERGSYFTHINGTAITSTNAVTLANEVLQGSSATFTMVKVDNGNIVEDGSITLASSSIAENPIYKIDTFKTGTTTIGYLFYNYFDDNFNNTLRNTGQFFKNAGVSELILDLRYNPGGSVAAAALINVLVAANINEETVFVKYSGNSRLGQRNIPFKSALAAVEAGAPMKFLELQNYRLFLSRVFILTSPKTASAAELTVNALKPFMKVVQIGETTLGKDKGAIIIKDMRSPQRIPWTLMPITYNLANSKGEGGYTHGITPQYQVDEMATQPLYPLGDTRDPLIAKAISIIEGNSRQAKTENIIVKKYYDGKVDEQVVKIPISLVR
jgi:carboxyl-terminal processing protease